MEAGMKAHSGEIKLISNHVSSGNGKCGYMERELYADGELVYKDRMSDTMFCFTAKHPDLLVALRLFCAGDYGISIAKHPPNVDFVINNDALIRLKPNLWHRIVKRTHNCCNFLKRLLIHPLQKWMGDTIFHS